MMKSCFEKKKLPLSGDFGPNMDMLSIGMTKLVNHNTCPGVKNNGIVKN